MRIFKKCKEKGTKKNFTALYCDVMWTVSAESEIGMMCSKKLRYRRHFIKRRKICFINFIISQRDNFFSSFLRNGNWGKTFHAHKHTEFIWLLFFQFSHSHIFSDFYAMWKNDIFFYHFYGWTKKIFFVAAKEQFWILNLMNRLVNVNFTYKLMFMITMNDS